MGLVGAETTVLAQGAHVLVDVAVGTDAAGRALDAAARSCAAALDGELAEELRRLAVATSVYADALATHVRATGWLAENLGADLERADGR